MKTRRFIAMLMCILMVAVVMPMQTFALDTAENETSRQYGGEAYGYAGTVRSPEWGRLRDVDLDNLLRIAGKTRFETALKVAEYARTQVFDGKFYNVVLVSGMDFPDALGAAGPAYDLEAPIILVDKNNIKEIAEYVGANLNMTSEWGGRVFIMGGAKAVPASMEEELINAGINSERIMRLSGANRYETNLAVLDGYSSIGATLVCSGKNYADALSASALGGPILLVGDELTDAQKAFLAEKGTTRFDIVGGTGAVSESVEASLKEIEGATVNRYFGKSRYETSKALAESFWNSSSSAVLTYGLNFPDGLSGAVMCFIAGAPMLLATSDQISVAAECAHNLGVNFVVVLGGEKLISDEAALTLVQ